MNVYCVQFESAWKNKQLNFKNIRSILTNYIIEKKSLIILPEMFATGFCLDPTYTLKDEPIKTEEFISDLAKEKDSWIIGGMCHPSEKSGFAYNTAVTFDPAGKRISLYKKINPIPTLGETNVHISGNNLEHITVGAFNITPLICYDLRFPELFRKGILEGTNLFVILGCWPKGRIKHWTTLLQARAIENQSFVIGVNRIGHDQDLVYGGRTMIISPQGEILADGKENMSVVNAKISKAEVLDWRGEFPVVQDYINNYNSKA